MYKEYRELSRTDAVEALYSDMAARHRARFRSIHVRNPNTRVKKTALANMNPRFSALSRLRSPRTSSALTSSNSSPRVSLSLSPTVSPASTTRRSSAPLVPPRSHKLAVSRIMCVVGGLWEMVFARCSLRNCGKFFTTINSA
jgi:hypothetical protein